LAAYFIDTCISTKLSCKIKLLRIKPYFGGDYMKQYEYRVEQIQIELSSILKTDKKKYNKEISEKLNVLGKEGWELSGVDGKWFYFKREII